jgi:uncharacterized surface protein with fasciclin (FAS1) repeats
MFQRAKALGATVLLATAVLAATPAMADSEWDWGHGCDPIGITRLPGKTIVDVAASSNDFSTLVSVLTSAQLVTTLQGKGPFTVFAPTNAAFGKIPKAVLGAITSDPKLLTAVLTYHVAAGRRDVRHEHEPVVLGTVQGEKVFVRTTCTNGTATLRVNNSTVTMKPIAVDNGIVYVIDSVLLPQF